ncbi:MAG: PatB family C-S lyase [Deltaproteobacteria bacterium]|jgi:cystathionine beta-lyase|nr:PatB family C-S lyase [Deltaproteobacteria bacterium]
MTASDYFDFDTPAERRGTASMKWEKYKDRDVIPMWVADMDFRSPPAVIRAIEQRAADGVFGYTLTPQALNDQVVNMLRQTYDWNVKPEWLVWLPGLVTGLNVACRAVGEDGDDVITAVPVYPPFLSAPGFSRRTLTRVPLKEKDNRWQFDFERLEQMITARTRMFILCNPHNPVGRVYTRSELTELAGICLKHNIVICSDEIHCGLILDEDKAHVPTATLDPEVAARTITLMAPSKTFNLPGLGCAFAVISDKTLRRRFKSCMAGIVPRPNVLGYAAAMAAFAECADWHAALLDYLRGNLATIAGVAEQMAPLSIAPVEATYLAWIDMRDSGLENPAKFFEAAGVGLQDGIEFDGPGFVRLNFGCPRSLLAKALERMKAALDRCHR